MPKMKYLDSELEYTEIPASSKWVEGYYNLDYSHDAHGAFVGESNSSTVRSSGSQTIMVSPIECSAYDYVGWTEAGAEVNSHNDLNNPVQVGGDFTYKLSGWTEPSGEVTREIWYFCENPSANHYKNPNRDESGLQESSVVFSPDTVRIQCNGRTENVTINGNGSSDFFVKNLSPELIEKASISGTTLTIESINEIGKSGTGKIKVYRKGNDTYKTSEAVLTVTIWTNEGGGSVDVT